MVIFSCLSNTEEKIQSQRDDFSMAQMTELDFKLLVSFFSQCSTLLHYFSQGNTRICSSNKLVVQYQGLNTIKIYFSTMWSLVADREPLGASRWRGKTVWKTAYGIFYGTSLGVAYIIAACILLSRPRSYDPRLNTGDAGKCSLFVYPGRRNSVANIKHFLHILSELCFNNCIENYINKTEGLMSVAEYPHPYSHPS